MAGPRLLSSLVESDVENPKSNAEEKNVFKKKTKGYNSTCSFDSGVDLKGFSPSIPEEPEGLSEVNYSYEHDCETDPSTKF